MTSGDLTDDNMEDNEWKTELDKPKEKKRLG